MDEMELYMDYDSRRKSFCLTSEGMTKAEEVLRTPLSIESTSLPVRSVGIPAVGCGEKNDIKFTYHPGKCISYLIFGHSGLAYVYKNYLDIQLDFA